MKKLNLAFKKHKKGSSILDILFICIVLLVIGIGFFFTKYSLSDINTDLQADPDMSVEGKAIMNAQNTNFSKWADSAFAFVFFGMMIVVLVTSYLIDSSPVFLVVSIIIFVFIIFIGATITNTFEEVVGESELQALQSQFPMTIFIMNNLLILITITFTLMIIVLYGKNSGGGLQ